MRNGENNMRRLVAIPVKSSVVVALLSVGALYVAADARQSVIRRYQNTISAQQPVVSPAAQLQSARPAAQAPANPSQTQNDEVVAEQQIAQLAAQKPAKKQNPHPRQIMVSI